MCSVISRQRADVQSALLAAVALVAENSLFACADACAKAAFDEAAAAMGAGAEWLRARIHFTGPVGGQFVLAVPTALARRLGAAFIGVETADALGDRDLVDFAGEFANMICGTWLTRTGEQAAFDLTPPRVIRSASHRVDGEWGDAESFYLTIDDTPIRLEIDWSTFAWGNSKPGALISATERADGC